MEKIKIGLITEIATLSSNQLLAEEFPVFSRHDIKINNIDGMDLIWVWSTFLLNPQMQSCPKVIATVHHIDPAKFNEQDFRAKDMLVHFWHVPCMKTKIQLEKLTDKPVYQLPYWVNNKIFFPMENRTDLRKKYNLPLDKMIIGSFQRDTEGSDLISPKLSKGPDIFADIIIELSKSFPIYVLLTSWRRQYLINRFTEKNIPFKYFELADRETVNELYNTLDWYFVTSRFEGGPEAILQCAQTKTKILSADVGMAKEILHEDCICQLKNDFIEKFKRGRDKTEDNYNNIQRYYPEYIIKKYDALFEEILN